MSVCVYSVFESGSGLVSGSSPVQEVLLLLGWLYSPCGHSPLFQFPDLFYSQSAGLLE
jgi:hypothetical protein